MPSPQELGKSPFCSLFLSTAAVGQDMNLKKMTDSTAQKVDTMGAKVLDMAIDSLERADTIKKIQQVYDTTKTNIEPIKPTNVGQEEKKTW